MGKKRAEGQEKRQKIERKTRRKAGISDGYSNWNLGNGHAAVLHVEKLGKISLSTGSSFTQHLRIGTGTCCSKVGEPDEAVPTGSFQFGTVGKKGQVYYDSHHFDRRPTGGVGGYHDKVAGNLFIPGKL